MSVDWVSYTNLVNDIDNSGVETSTLTVINIPKQKEEYCYRLLISNSNTTYTVTPSNAVLTLCKS